MDDNIKTQLYDILISINEIESYFIETPKIFEIYHIYLRIININANNNFTFKQKKYIYFFTK